MRGNDGIDGLMLDPDGDGLLGAPSRLVQDVEAVQQRLRQQEVDGWLLYDFRGSNPTASAALGLDGLMLTRRVLYFIPQQGQPTLLCHAVDASNLPSLPGRVQTYSGWRDLDRTLRAVLRGARRVAMEYFPGGAIPYISRVDAGTVGWIREMGPEVVSSADLVQYFLCRFTADQAEAHKQVALTLDRIKNEAFAMVVQRLGAGYPLVEYEIQQFIMELFSQERLVTDHPPIIAAGRNTADPHYLPSPDSSARIEPDQLLQLIIWARHDDPVCAYADLAWMAFTGESPPERQRELFGLVVEARDAGLQRVKEGYDPGSRDGLRGWEVDRAVRDLIEARGYGDCFPHRAGHNIGALSGHGDGTHIDDLETHDTRSLIQGLCFSLEPGIYLDDFGVRSGINVYLGPEGPEVYAPVQKTLILLPAGYH
jgi:Xaa-Pro aminopeptidase